MDAMSCRLAAASLVALLLAPALPAAAAEDDALIGLWATEPDEFGYAHVRIRREGDEYRGEIVWLSEPTFPDSEGPEWAGKPKVDRLNPDPALRDRPIIGLPLLWGFRAKGPGQWAGGFIYDPASGKTYKCKITLQDDGTLKVRGFVGISLLGRTTIWRPVAEAAAEPDAK
ncbi:MAG: DUF2147 domain-containing protein [Acidobacteria bacterium]|nr:MAG: DUF2147 domain-containing protein [Acidobacteriota bacterium]